MSQIAQHVDRSELKIGLARSFERDMILALWGEQFGFYDRADHAAEWVDTALDHDHHGAWCYTIGAREELAAFLLLRRVAIEDFDAEIGADADTSDWPKAAWNVEPYMVAVADYWQRQGFATILHQRAVEKYLRPNDYRRLYATCWIRDQPGSPELFASLGYERVTVIEDYYATDDGEPDRDCPDCGVGCECPAAIYTTALEGDT